MTKRIVYSFILMLLCVSMGYAQKLAQYEYWIDNDYASRTTVNSSQKEITAAIDLKNTSQGVHFFNFRTRNDAGETCSPYRYIFYVPEVTDANVKLARYEYWIDNDYANRVTASTSQEEMTFATDISSLETGVHFYNFRTQSTDGSYSQPYRFIFYIPDVADASVQLARYEYWIDDDYANRVTASTSQEEMTFAADISSLETGVHFYNFRTQSTDGSYSQPYRFIFYIPEVADADAKLARYEYWIDDDYANRVTGSASQEDMTFVADISSLEQGVHFYNFRTQSTDGTYSQPFRFIFFIPENTENGGTDLAGMRYSFNELTATLPLTGTEYEMNDYAISLPDILDVAKIDGSCQFKFDAEKDSVTLNRTTNVNFMLQFVNKAGKWSAPEVANYTETDCIQKKAHQLEMQKTVKFDKVKQGDYEAVTFEIAKTGTYYLRSLEACTLDLYYDNGKKVNTISQNALFNTYAIGLAAGKYYGVVYNTVKDTTYTADQVGLRLMLTANYVPTPEFTYENETVTITCPQEDVKIYYTVDGTDPTTNSMLYTVPFEMKQNATIKAIAVADGFADSYVGTLKIDSYKVATPVIEFANLSVYITCTTPDSRIYYSLDGKDPLTDGERYTEPISVSQNCVVRAVAKRDGYNNSDEARYDLDVTNVKCVTPELAVVDNVLTITTLTNGASIYYTIDGSVPTTSSTLYTTPILLDHNCTYKAIAMKDGELTSEMSEYTVDWFQAVRPAISFEDGIVTITCTQGNVKIYYTTDGTKPTVDSNLYTRPFNVSGNGIVKAFCTADYFIDSDVAEYEIGSYKVDKPEMEFSRMKLYLTCSTPGAKILYTLDNSNPLEKGMEYTEPIELSQSVIVRAVGVYEGYNNSDELYYALDFNEITCPVPVFAHDSRNVTISCATDGATIYYTMDGTEPTEESLVYTAPIAVEHNCIIKAYAVKNHWIDSSVGTQSVDWFTVPRPEIAYNGGIVTINCEKEDAKVYYTTDGTNPTAESILYTEPFTYDINGIIKAIGLADDFNNSDIAVYEIGSYKVAKPEMEFTRMKLYLTCSTPGAKILYTLDNSDPLVKGVEYTEPVTLTQSVIVRAVGVYEGYNNSDELYHNLVFNEITCAKPVFTHDSESVTISCETEGATIYYTMDGTEPTEESTVYTAPVAVEHNYVIKAYVVKNHWIDSSVETLNVDWFTVATPVFALKDSTLTITCETPGAKIYYAWAGEEPTRESLEYTAPIKLVDNRMVKAFAVKDDFNDSEVVTFTTSMFKCAPAEIAYNGRYVTLTTETENATILYTLDGSEPTDRSTRYTDVFELEGITSVEQLPLIRTLVKKAYTNDSELSQYKAPAIYSGEKDVYVGSAGSLSKAFEWVAPLQLPRGGEFSVHGSMNASDATYLRGITDVSVLNLNDVAFEGNSLPDKAFAEMKNLKWVTLPSSLKSVGGELFSGCGSLAAITWNPTINIPDDIIGDMKLPNLLLYVKASGYVSSRFGNVIVNGIASAITLADDTQSNFFCPEQFTARSIQYTHNFTQQTVPGVCQGWESIALPFAPQKFEHETNGEIAPFASASDGKKPFWLYKYTEDGFVRTDAMDANVAYIISMPNNDVYADAYMLGGNVTFSAVNTAVKASNDVIVSERGLIGFYPNFTHQNTDNGMMVVNVGEEYMGHAEGSVFVSGLRYIRPFEGYMHTATAGSRAIMRIFEDSVTDGIDDILAKTDVRVWLEDGVLKAECPDRSTLPIRDINGTILRTEVLHSGINTINDLPNGLYIVNGRKFHIHGR